VRLKVSKREKTVAEQPPWKLLLWTAIAGLVFGLIGFGEVAEDWLRVARNSFHRHAASGDIVLVDIDDRSLAEVGRWPWPRSYYAGLSDRLTKAGANRIFFDLMFEGATNPRDDRSFSAALARSKPAVLAVRVRTGARSGGGVVPVALRPYPPIAAQAQLATVSMHYNYQNAIWRLPYFASYDGQVIPSFSAKLGNRTGSGDFQIDYSIDPNTIPRISAADIFNGRFDPRAFAGKDVVIGITSDAGGDLYFIPGTGKMGGAFVQIIAAETLKNGRPIDGGWATCLLLTLALVAWGLHRPKARQRQTVLAANAALLLLGPIFAEAHLLFIDVTPALFALILVESVLGWRRFRLRGLVNPISNLPNLSALRTDRRGRNQALVAARILNYEEIVATLPPEKEQQLIEQIVARLNVGSPGRSLYQGDGGVFAWFEDPDEPFGNHIEALYSLFRNPARVAKLSIDLSIAFGVEVGSGRSLANRLASALVAADEAAHDGLKWKVHDPETLEDASWKLSMLSQLDEAIDRGEVWVAYQPKLDIATRRIIGAEALARWTHPEKGPIAASEFVAAAEQNNRIGKLTDFVMDKAIAAAAHINKRGADFNVAVNLSARLLTDKGFTLRLSALLAKYGLAPNRLTLELTETAALANNGEGLDMIARLRNLGLNIAIDDYGTGQSTLDYLKRIPANEIKIDQSFVKGIVDNRSDRLMVQSTIGLVHSLGRKVVAEGVENRDILEVLVALECDIAQGFAVGRPMSLEGLTRRVTSGRRRTAA
jgi:EAL domain-containing protein (putative c-di-GMP-specific phosphodiesterase class I)/CHASE2 domain-containing sensor protein